MAGINPNKSASNESTYLVSSKKISMTQRLKNLFIYLFQKIGINFAQHSRPLEGRALIFNPLNSTLEAWTSSAQKTNIVLYRINDSKDNPLFELKNVDILKPKPSDTRQTLENKLNVLKALKKAEKNLTPKSQKILNKLLENVPIDELEKKLDAFRSIENAYSSKAYKNQIFSDFSPNIQSICIDCLFNPQNVRPQLEKLIKTKPQEMCILLPLLEKILVPAVINDGDYTDLTKMAEKKLTEKIAREEHQAQAQQSRRSPKQIHPPETESYPPAFRPSHHPKAATPGSAPRITSGREYSPMAEHYDSIAAQNLFPNSTSDQREYLQLCSDHFVKNPETRMKALKAFAQKYPQEFKTFLRTCINNESTKNAFTHTWFNQDSKLFYEFNSFVEKLDYHRSYSFSPPQVFSYVGTLRDPIDNLDEFYKNQLSESEKQNIRQGNYTISQEEIEDKGWLRRPYLIRNTQGDIMKILEIPPHTPEEKGPRREDWS